MMGLKTWIRKNNTGKYNCVWRLWLLSYGNFPVGANSLPALEVDVSAFGARGRRSCSQDPPGEAGPLRPAPLRAVCPLPPRGDLARV